MPRGTRTAQTPFEKDGEFQVEAVIAKKYMKVAVEGGNASSRHGKKPYVQKEQVLHYEIKWHIQGSAPPQEKSGKCVFFLFNWFEPWAQL